MDDKKSKIVMGQSTVLEILDRADALLGIEKSIEVEDLEAMVPDISKALEPVQEPINERKVRRICSFCHHPDCPNPQ